jgi:hypothetical protein
MPQDDFDVITGPSVERNARQTGLECNARQVELERKPRQASKPEREAEQKAA